MPDAVYGLGYPFFNYYAALPYYLAAGLVLWGWGPIAALKVTQALGFLASGAGMYALGRHTFHRRASALLASVAYVYVPFHLANVYVRGDSLSEFYAFIWYPLLGCALLRLRKHISAGNVLLLGGVYAGLILTHNISTLITTPVAVAYALLLLFASGRGGSLCPPSTKASRRRFLLAGLAGGLLGLGLSSWFWLPALLEGHLVQLQEMTTGYFHFAGHFRGLDLIQRKWLFDYTIGEDRTPFCMGQVQALLVALGSLTLISGWIRQRRIVPQEAFALGLLLLITLCITPLSHPLWEHVPLLSLVQFPWRFLSLQAVFTALLTGCLTEGWRWRVPDQRWMAILLSGILMVAALGSLRLEWLAIGEADVNPDLLRLYEYFTANIGTTVRREYLPRTVETRPFTSAVYLNRRRKPLPMTIEGKVTEAHLLDFGPTWETWDIAVASPQAHLAFHTHYFPGWRATVDGSPRSLAPVEGWGTIGLFLSQGHHRLTLRLGRTPLRRAAELISLLALVAALSLVALTIHRLPQERRRRWSSLIGLAVIGFVLGRVALRHLSTQPTPCAVLAGLPFAARHEDLSMDFIRQPYLHHNPKGICFGDTAQLLRYTLSADEVQAGESLTVTLAWDAKADKSLTATVRLVSAAEPLFGASPVEAESSLPLQVGQTVHPLEVPPAAVPGPHLLAVEVFHGEKHLAPVTSQGKKLGTTYLRPVWIQAVEHEVSAQERLAQFGDRIALLAAQAEQRSPQRLSVRLAWQALQPIPANYNLSLRLKNPSGQRIAVRDLQPHYGFYPTSLWPPGVTVEDFLLLPIPKSTPPGSGYTLEVILYPVSTLIPVGQAEVRDVQILEGLSRRSGAKLSGEYGGGN